jgi:hypothetical protein
VHAKPAQRTELSPFSFFTQPGGPSVSVSDPAQHPQPAPRPAATKIAKSVGEPRQASSKHVCVRLCDGFFFPAPTGVSASDASCATACPSAPTRLYSMRSDRITDAVAVRTGAPYTKLPVALQYTRTREQTCSCGSTDPRVAIMSDASLLAFIEARAMRGLIDHAAEQDKQMAMLWQALEKMATGTASLDDCKPNLTAKSAHLEIEKLNKLID